MSLNGNAEPVKAARYIEVLPPESSCRFSVPCSKVQPAQTHIKQNSVSSYSAPRQPVIANRQRFPGPRKKITAVSIAVIRKVLAGGYRPSKFENLKRVPYWHGFR